MAQLLAYDLGCTPWRNKSVAQQYDQGMAGKRSKNRYAVEFARKGGTARAKQLSPERRREIARKAVLARWARQKAKESLEGP